MRNAFEILSTCTFVTLPLQFPVPFLLDKDISINAISLEWHSFQLIVTPPVVPLSPSCVSELGGTPV